MQVASTRHGPRSAGGQGRRVPGLFARDQLQSATISVVRHAARTGEPRNLIQQKVGTISDRNRRKWLRRRDLSVASCPLSRLRSEVMARRAVVGELDFYFFYRSLSFLIVPYRSDPWTRRLAPACKYSAEAGFGPRWCPVGISGN
jgi:hypothetical protein